MEPLLVVEPIRAQRRAGLGDPRTPKPFRSLHATAVQPLTGHRGRDGWGDSPKTTFAVTSRGFCARYRSIAMIAADGNEPEPTPAHLDAIRRMAVAFEQMRSAAADIGQVVLEPMAIAHPRHPAVLDAIEQARGPDPGHRPPVLGCQCGFYGVPPRSDHQWAALRWGGTATLDVNLTGRVIEADWRHEHAWRAERQTVTGVRVDPWCRACREGQAVAIGIPPGRGDATPVCDRCAVHVEAVDIDVYGAMIGVDATWGHRVTVEADATAAFNRIRSRAYAAAMRDVRDAHPETAMELSERNGWTHGSGALLAAVRETHRAAFDAAYRDRMAAAGLRGTNLAISPSSAR